jgi:hypothetical protein
MVDKVHLQTRECSYYYPQHFTLLPFCGACIMIAGKPIAASHDLHIEAVYCHDE